MRSIDPTVGSGDPKLGLGDSEFWVGGLGWWGFCDFLGEMGWSVLVGHVRQALRDGRFAQLNPGDLQGPSELAAQLRH